MVYAFADSQPAASARRRTAARAFGNGASVPGGHSRIVKKSTRDQRCVAAPTRTIGRGVWPRKSPRTRRCAEARLDRRIPALSRPTRARAQYRFPSNQARRAPPGVPSGRQAPGRGPPWPRARSRTRCAEPFAKLKVSVSLGRSRVWLSGYKTAPPQPRAKSSKWNHDLAELCAVKCVYGRFGDAEAPRWPALPAAALRRLRRATRPPCRRARRCQPLARPRPTPGPLWERFPRPPRGGSRRGRLARRRRSRIESARVSLDCVVLRRRARDVWRGLRPTLDPWPTLRHGLRPVWTASCRSATDRAGPRP